MSFVKLPRELLDHPISHNPECLSVFIHMILDAAYQDKIITFNGEKIQIKKGQLIYGRQSYAQKTGLTEAVLRRVIRRLEKWQVIGRTSTKRYSVITVLTSELWQEVDQANGTTKNITSNTNNIIPREDAKKPSFPEVSNFIKAKKLTIDAEDFFNYYNTRGWKFPNGQSVENWQSLAYSWNKREQAKAKPQTSWEVIK